jgi:hypothetical protein
LSGSSCASSTCQPKKADGATCVNAFECTSGQCTDRYADSDGDSWGSTFLGRRCGAPVAFEVSRGGDCCDSNNQAFPGQTAFFSIGTGCGGLPFDYDCNGAENPNDSLPEGISCVVAGGCGNFCVSGNGWQTTRPPCGVTGTTRSCGNTESGLCGSGDPRFVCSNVSTGSRQVLCR